MAWQGRELLRIRANVSTELSSPCIGGLIRSGVQASMFPSETLGCARIERHLEVIHEDYFLAHRDPAALERLADRYGVDHLVLDADPERRIAYLVGPSTWGRVYWDPLAEVFLRRNERHAAFVGAHEYRLTHAEADLSYLLAYRHDLETWNGGLAELRPAVQDNPQNELAWQGLAQEYGVARPGARGQRPEALSRELAVLVGNPATGRLHAEKAETLPELAKSEEARAEAQRALQLDGDLLFPRRVLAVVAERCGAWAEVRDHLRTILTHLPPDDPEAQRIRGRLETVERNAREGSNR